VTNPAQTEGALHVARQRIISNKALLHNAARTGLPSFIQARPFSLRMWQPPNFTVAPTPIRPPENVVDAGPVQNTDIQIPADEADSTPQHSLNSVDFHDPVSQKSDSVPEGGEGEPSRKRQKRRQEEQCTQWLGNKVLS
jgi:endoribonuclease Dicer